MIKLFQYIGSIHEWRSNAPFFVACYIYMYGFISSSIFCLSAINFLA